MIIRLIGVLNLFRPRLSLPTRPAQSVVALPRSRAFSRRA